MGTEMRLIPDRYRVLSGSALKCMALCFMIIDHVALVLLRNSHIVLFQMGSGPIELYTIMRKVGRLSFPLYCFLLTEGFQHTKDRRKYGVSLLLFALLSEIPWNLEHTGTLLYGNQNVFFTLFLGFLGLCAVEMLREKPWTQMGSLLLLFLIALLLKADYGVTGFGFILLLYILREHRVLQAVLGSCFLPSTWVGGLAFLPINLYNGKRGFIQSRVVKYLFYAAYPVHILILYLIRKQTIGY